MSTRIWLRRAYDPPTRNDGRRILVDRLWPRGVAKDDARIDEWVPEVAPSAELRCWFGHDPERWESFHRRYREERHNNTVVLREYLEEAAERSEGPSSSWLEEEQGP